MALPDLKQSIFNDATFMGLRSTIGVIFILHGISKFAPGFAENLPHMGLPPEMQIPIALAEIIPGVLLIIGILSKISSAMLSVIMMGAIFAVKGAGTITGKGGVEFDLILLAASLIIMIAGPGRMSLVYVVKKLPKILH